METCTKVGFVWPNTLFIRLLSCGYLPLYNNLILAYARGHAFHPITSIGNLQAWIKSGSTALSKWQEKLRKPSLFVTLLTFRFSSGSVSVCTRRISIVVYNYFCSSNNRNPVRAFTYTSTWKSKTPKCCYRHMRMSVNFCSWEINHTYDEFLRYCS